MTWLPLFLILVAQRGRATQSCASTPPTHGHAPAVVWRCESWCAATSCSELTGNFRLECGGCGAHARCGPAATEFALDAEPSTSAARVPTGSLRAGHGDVRHLFTVPVLTAKHTNLTAAQHEIKRLVLAKYAEKAAEMPERSPADVNNGFFGYQADGDDEWIRVRDACLRRMRYGPQAVGAADCEEEADNAPAAWPELRTSWAWKQIKAAIHRSLAAYLEAAGVTASQARCPTPHISDMSCWELDSSGAPILWMWTAVHTDGVNHPAHDHPQSLASGTFYVATPAGVCGLGLQLKRFQGARLLCVDCWSGEAVEGCRLNLCVAGWETAAPRSAP